MRKTRSEPTGFGTVRQPDVQLLRRSWLKQAASGLVAAGLWPVRGRAAAGEPAVEVPDGLIIRNRRPLDLETPVAALDSWLTSTDAFFVRSHLGEPAQGLFPWSVDVRGMVDKPLALGPDDWKGFEPHTVTAVLQCSGNGRAFFRPRMPGVAWERGAVGHAEWSGVRLADVLARAGLKQGAAHVHFLGADSPPSPKTPAFLRSIPLEKALHPDMLLVTRMNGCSIPPLHGGPVRLMVPGWTGNHWIKWVRWITVAQDEAPGFYMQTAYRMPKTPAPPDAVLKPSDLVPVTAMNVKSLITWPAEGAKLIAGRHEVRGVAWTGDGHVERVDVALGKGDERKWRPAELVDEARPWSWRRWRCSVEVSAPNPVTISARATDSNGQTQPESTPHNKSGYLWNGIDRVSCEAS